MLGVRRAGWLLLIWAIVIASRVDPAAAEAIIGPFATLPSGDAAYGLAIGPDGAIYVSDASGPRSASILAYGPNGDLQRRIEVPAGPTNQVSLRGLAFDRAGNLYVADLGDGLPEHGRIVAVSQSGRQSVLASGLTAPGGLAIDRFDILYVADGLNGTVRWLGLDGASAVFVEDDRLRPHLRRGFGASGLALAPNGGALYVSNTADNRVFRISIGSDGAAGKLSLVADGGSKAGGALDGPEGLVVDGRGNLLVAASRADEIDLLTTDGRLLQRLRGPDREAASVPTGLVLSGQTGYVAYLSGPRGLSTLGRLSLPELYAN